MNRQEESCGIPLFQLGEKMRQIITAIGILCIVIGVFGLSYTWSYDHRSVEYLDEYATIEMQTSLNGDAKLEGVTLSLWVYRYDKAKFLPKAMLFTDGDPWEMVASVKQQKSTSRQFPQLLQTENKIFMEFPRSSLPAILMSKQIKFRLYFDDGSIKNLLLSDDKLKEWKRQMR